MVEVSFQFHDNWSCYVTQFNMWPILLAEANLPCSTTPCAHVNLITQERRPFVLQ